MERCEGDADADRRRQLAPGCVDRVAERALQLLSNTDRLGFVRAGQRDDELVTADAPGDPFGPDAPIDAVGNDAQEVIAATVSEHVVDRLEAIEIQEEHTDRLLGSRRVDQRFAGRGDQRR